VEGWRWSGLGDEEEEEVASGSGRRACRCFAEELGIGSEIFLLGAKDDNPATTSKTFWFAYGFPSAIFFNPFLLFCFFLFTTTNCLRKRENEKTDTPSAPTHLNHLDHLESLLRHKKDFTQ
jgi:hypothetical protein